MRNTTKLEAGIATTIRERRKACELTQQELTRMMNRERCMNWSPTTCTKVETGDRKLTAAELLTLCRILGLTLADFPSGTE